MSNEDYIRVSEAARLRGVGRQAIYYLINNNRVRTTMRFGLIAVYRPDVMKLGIKADKRRKNGKAKAT